MNLDAAVGRLEALIDEDPSYAHREADRVLCNLLEEIGYGDVVEAYEEVGKLYDS